MTDLSLRALENQIDRLIEPWAKDFSPGVTLGVVRGRELIAHRHAGFASIEHGVPIGPGTRFRIASVSKQFTCAAILLLAERGLLDIAAPARSLLPDLPEAYAPITIAQLMHNTSGIRDMLEIQRQGGGDLGTPLTATDLLAGIQRQRTLNFAPGTRYLYSNSNFFLLGLIVEKLSGLPLERFLESEIFAPLGMTATAHTPNVSVPVPHLAAGYVEHEGRMIRAPHAFPLGGEGGLVSSVTDLAIWAVNARERGVPGPRVLDGLEQPAPFVNGEANFYARGLITRRYRGVATLSHGGLWPGFRTEYLRVPGHDLAVIAIANHGGIDPNQLAYRVLDAMLDRAGVVSAPAMPGSDAVRGLAGRFMSPESGATVDITVAEDGAVTLNTYGMPVVAAPTDDGFLAVPRSSTVFAVRAIDGETIEVRLDAGTVERWVRVPDGAVLPDDLAGTYESAEMAARWIVSREVDGGLSVRAHGPVVRGPEWRIEPITERDMRLHILGTLMRGWLDVRLERDGAGAVAALLVSGGRAKAVRFERA
ncbi:serine hydrolase domain-containing protein [Elioraea rosea]|uniref:serine hydrolase domain-containing protein n=1 Tax=Elioraea rosea TaxID=2492390 RepID=UPI001EF499E1|nr:serine hydrolase domain-containing protein [Elioraea rosea]